MEMVSRNVAMWQSVNGTLYNHAHVSDYVTGRTVHSYMKFEQEIIKKNRRKSEDSNYFYIPKGCQTTDIPNVLVSHTRIL
jgi:hypothetical protein